MSFFSKNLRFLRRRGDFSQDEIATLFNKRPNTVGNWENRKSEPSLGELIRLGEFFKVSTHDLLHKDLEKSGFQAAADIQPDSPEQKLKSYPITEHTNSMANEESHDAFWLILRELRSMNEKVDSLISGMQSSGFNKNSDKSAH
jgi:transcriptional regulator with XRE-family HTH domain